MFRPGTSFTPVIRCCVILWTSGNYINDGLEDVFEYLDGDQILEDFLSLSARTLKLASPFAADPEPRLFVAPA